MITNKNKMKNTIKWIIELSIWFFIFLGLANFLIFIKANNDKQYNSYQIFMPDVDGVIVGSPVHMMGVPIGYVNKIKIIDNEVFVRFRLTQKDLKLPKGSTITVEFNGLGGSKSLEVYPPTEESKNREEYIVVEAPKRLGAIVGLIDDMFEKISSITYRVSFFAKETSKSYDELEKDIKNPEIIENIEVVEDIKEVKTVTSIKNKDKKDFSKILKETNKWLDETTNKLENFNNKIQ